MKTTHIVARESLKEITKRYDNEEDKRKKKKWLCIRLWIVRSRNAKTLAEDSWLSKSVVQKTTAWYNKFWPLFIQDKPGKWWDRYTKKVDREKEKMFFESITTWALKWKYRTADEIAEVYKVEVRWGIWKDSIYCILYRLWWKSWVPRQSHPKKKSEQKKNSRKTSTE